jgi:hypothetical protein
MMHCRKDYASAEQKKSLQNDLPWHPSSQPGSLTQRARAFRLQISP